MSQTSSCILSVEPEEFDGIDNIVDLPNRSSDKVIAFMRKRFLSKEFYTWAGQTLLSLHPYEAREKKCKGDDHPGVDSLISGAWFRLKHGVGKPHQHVVISGESGSGKTHSACLAMQRIVDIVGETNRALYGIWSTVPLLSAFGNAKTGYNCNSSRFGKLVQIHCVDGMSIDGCTLSIFMLEKSRVTGPATGEGNFHIFRQILDVLEEDALQLLYLSKTIDYKIAPHSEMKPRYRETLIALEALEIYALEDILSVLAIILNLGNVKFESVGDIYTVSTDSLEFVENVGRLLDAKPKDLINLICTRVFAPKSRRETIYQSACMNREECEERRDCIMKLLYDRLFSWLVHCINVKFEQSCVYDQKSLSILDIYGFEVFDHNGFEQLCINYANERLQQYFIDNYLLERRIRLIEEGFDVEHIETVEYTQRLSLIHGPISIFGILNEQECAMKRFNSDVFVNTRLTETLRSKPHFIGSLNQLHTAFSIKHYAGVVKYDTRSMLGKNRDKVPDDIISFLKGCESFEFLCHLMSFAPLTNGKTLVTNFKKSLDNLFDVLNDGDVHYVKCLKPNPYHMAEFFDEHFFEQQLVANGVCEIFKLNFQQFSLR
ncbi:PREDICTED: myosin-2-like [Nicrophorus vespilloides]|uniref:Myosin-2-like n=1 Tax=Nicrophorus vespilloides TaxID=110193 RepID=A0ABM1NFD8_NICVS|nr:PREDICTED: myosin-2-like [Nicrophorus vespilloides]